MYKTILIRTSISLCPFYPFITWVIGMTFKLNQSSHTSPCDKRFGFPMKHTAKYSVAYTLVMKNDNKNLTENYPQLVYNSRYANSGGNVQF